MSSQESPSHRFPRLTFERSLLEESRLRLYTESTLASIFREVVESKAQKILEVGAGTGFFLNEFTRRSATANLHVANVDIDHALLRANSMQGSRVCADASRLPFLDAQFDLVLCHFFLSRVSAQVATVALREISRVLTPGGLLLAVEPCLGSTVLYAAHDDLARVYMGIARAEKARANLLSRGVDEDFGYALPRAVAANLSVTLMDLHVARWYTVWPGPLDEEGREMIEGRIQEISGRDPVQGLMDAHKDAETVAAEGAEPILVGPGGRPELSAVGYERLNRLRLDGLERIASGRGTSEALVELIPVVRVLARRSA